MQRYNVYFEGKLLEGFALPQVRANLGKLFNADEQTLDRLFNGELQSLKLDCDKGTALKYQRAMKRAGAQPIIQEAPGEEATDSPTPAQEPAAAGSPADSVLDLCPEGTDVLSPAERPGEAPPSVSAPELDVDAAGERLSPPTEAPPPAPGTDHLSMGEVGEIIPNLPAQQAPLDPDISALELTPEGTDFSDCAAADAEPPELDLSPLSLAPAESEVLEQQYRKPQDDLPPPDTGGLSTVD